MTENEKIELFDKWYDENYDEWAEGEEGIALREELEQAFKGGIAELEKENAELKEALKGKRCSCMTYLNLKDLEKQLTKATEIIKKLYAVYYDPCVTESDLKYRDELFAEAEQFLSEVEK